MLDPRERPRRAARRHRARRRDRRDRRAGRARRRPTAREVVDGDGRHLLPGFVDPHVHLRTPGQEHKEDLETGTRAAAAGGFCAVARDAEHRPGRRLRADPALAARRRRARRARPGRLPARDHARARGRRADRDGRAARRGRARLHRRRPPGRRAPACCATRCSTSGCAAACSRCTRRTRRCRAAASMHEGEVSALLGVAGIPSVSESTMVARDAALAGYEGGPRSTSSTSAARRRSRRSRRAKAARRGDHRARPRPHHLCLTHEAVRGAGHAMKMNPPLRTEDDRQALIEGLRIGRHRLRRDRPRAARARREGGPVRAGADGHDRPGDGVRRALHRARRCPGVLPLALLVERMTRRRRAVRPADAADRGRRAGQPRARRPRRRVARRRARLREPLGELLLRRPAAARPRAADRRRRRASPTASARSRWCGRVSAARRRAVGAFSRRARASSGLPLIVTEQYPHGPRLRRSPRWSSTSRACRALAEDRVLRRARRRLRPAGPRPGARLRHRDARLREPDRARPDLDAGSRCTSPRDAVSSRTPADREAGLERMERRRRGPVERRDGAVRAARRRPAATSSRRSRS